MITNEKRFEEDIESFNALCKGIDRTQNNAFIFFLPYFTSITNS